MELGPETRLPECWPHLLFTITRYPVLVRDHSTPTTFHREIHQSQVQSTRKIHCKIKEAVLVETFLVAYPTPFTSER